MRSFKESIENGLDYIDAESMQLYKITEFMWLYNRHRKRCKEKGLQIVNLITGDIIGTISYDTITSNFNIKGEVRK